MRHRIGRSITRNKLQSPELFAEDKKALHPLPSVAFEVYRLERVKADNYGKVKYNNKIYSSSPVFAGRQLWIKRAPLK